MCVVLGSLGLAHGQNSIKLSQQSTSFFYAQMSLHAGFSNPIANGSGDGLQLGLPGRGTSNQVSFQLQKIHQPLLQKGYTPLLAIDSWRLRSNLSYSQTTSTFEIAQPVVNNPNGPGPGNGGGPGQGQGAAQQGEVPVLVGESTNGHINLNLQDAWIKFKTKWDRTTIKVGYAPMSFGHNPEVDANASFMTNLVGTEFGYSRDLGMSIKTPISRDLDAEVGLYSGGVIGNPILQTNPDEVVAGEEEIGATGTWMLTGRIGQPSFKKSEVGLLMAVGNIAATFGSDPEMQVMRLGGEWVYKFRERLHATNQLVIGQTKTASEGNFVSFTMQNNLDMFVSQHWMIGVSNSLNLQNSTSDGTNYLKSTLAGSLTYAVSPHTRIRLNQFVTARDYSGGSNWGLSLQFVTGLGKR